MLSARRPPQVSDPEMARVVQDIYDTLNQLITAVNSGQPERTTRGTEGKMGDIAHESLGGGKYNLKVRTKDGWIVLGDARLEGE